MSFLPSVSSEAGLLDVFKKFPATAYPLLQYHEVLMRGPSPLSVGERELLAAYVSGLNACQYCHGVHAVTAGTFGIAPDLLKHLLENPEHALIDARMKPLLAFAKKLTLTPSRLTQQDADLVFAAGWDEQALHDSVSVCALFNFMNRLVEGLGISLSPGMIATGAFGKYMGMQFDEADDHPEYAEAAIRSVVPRWQPLQYVGRADDIAQAALFLASDASRFMTGHNLVVDGGISAGWPIAAARPDRELFFRTIQASRSPHSA